MNTIYQTTQYYFASILFHALVMVMAGMYFDFSKTPPMVGDALTTTVHSYLYHDVTPKPVRAEVAEDKGKIKIQSRPRQDKAENTTQQRINSQGGSKGQHSNELLEMLHAAIQSKQHYPLVAQQMERQGRVTVKFNLQTNGTVGQLRIVKSSGTASLDQAALAAVQEAVPFPHVDKFLHAPDEFSVDVVFELA